MVLEVVGRRRVRHHVATPAGRCSRAARTQPRRASAGLARDPEALVGLEHRKRWLSLRSSLTVPSPSAPLERLEPGCQLAELDRLQRNAGQVPACSGAAPACPLSRRPAPPRPASPTAPARPSWRSAEGAGAGLDAREHAEFDASPARAPACARGVGAAFLGIGVGHDADYPGWTGPTARARLVPATDQRAREDRSRRAPLLAVSGWTTSPGTRDRTPSHRSRYRPTDGARSDA
jgi:hypothetical protein